MTAVSKKPTGLFLNWVINHKCMIAAPHTRRADSGVLITNKAGSGRGQKGGPERGNENDPPPPPLLVAIRCHRSGFAGFGLCPSLNLIDIIIVKRRVVRSP